MNFMLDFADSNDVRTKAVQPVVSPDDPKSLFPGSNDFDIQPHEALNQYFNLCQSKYRKGNARKKIYLRLVIY